MGIFPPNRFQVAHGFRWVTRSPPRPDLLVDEARLRNTSFGHRIPPETRVRGLEATRRALATGELGRRVRDSLESAGRVGHGTVFSA